MTQLFTETFEARHGELPDGWTVECNSDLKAISAIRRIPGGIEFLSAGNKYIPVIPDVKDCRIDMTIGINYTMAKQFGIILCFRYDVHSRTGQAVRFSSPEVEEELVIEYGTMACNRFTAEQKQVFPILDASKLDAPLAISADIRGTALAASFGGQAAQFTIPEGNSGKVALSRNHFFDVLTVTAFSIQSDENGVCQSEQSYTVPLPAETTLYPLFCDVTLRDFGDCMEALLSYRGGVEGTEPGEGNYHVIRTDVITRPFLKVITAESTEEHVVYDEKFFNIVANLAPDYFYKKLHKKAPWPLNRTVRFMKPSGDFNLAVGFEAFRHSTLANFEQSPTETVFMTDGTVIYSGLGLSSGAVSVSFRSNPKKQMAARIPKTDPRRKQALDFLKANHFFIEGETARFSIAIRGKALPLDFAVTLEDAYFRVLKKLRASADTAASPIGAMPVLETVLTLPALRKLAPGVYHLRVRSTDPTAEPLNDYCAFEVMSKDPNALPPPLLSGLPYLYNSRTETRGLLTDGFDVWFGASSDQPHYMACANFLPHAARTFQIAPTVHAYGREFFCWLGTRCCDKYLAADNMDLVAQADYVHCSDELEQYDMTWGYTICGPRLQAFIDLARKLNDPAFDIPALEERLSKGDAVDYGQYKYMLTHYWNEWLDAVNACSTRLSDDLLVKLRTVNPKIKFSAYGPGHIYASHYKGLDLNLELQSADTAFEEHGCGFMQYEDYPYACKYGLERGIYYMTVNLMFIPNARIYPEIYTGGGIQGCPDGAVFYANPPFGLRDDNRPLRMTRRVYEYALASAYIADGKIAYWNRCGFQACNFTRPWFEALLNGWRIVRDYPPVRPLRAPAFVSSEASRRAHGTFLGGSPYSSIFPVRCTAAEDVPYAYEMWRRAGGNAGCMVKLEDIAALNPAVTDFVVLPPLKGISQAERDAIRALHAKGVGLLAFEDAPGLEDIFGIKDTGKFYQLASIQAEDDFMDDWTGPRQEPCCDPHCGGTVAADGAQVLMTGKDIDGNTVPVLLLNENGPAPAAFFTIPPQMVRPDELHERHGYGLDSISDFADAAVKAVMMLLARPEAETSAGRLIAYRSASSADVVIIENPDPEAAMVADVEIQKAPGRRKLISCSGTHTLIGEDDECFSLRLRLPKEECAVLIFK